MTIPNVPVDVRSRFARRLSQAPEMECLTKTYLSKNHTDAAEPTVDPPTTMSVERPFSPLTIETSSRHHRRRHTDRAPVTRLKRSLSLLRNKPEGNKTEGEHGEDDSLSKVVDLGTVASSLGHSPYAAAMTTAPKIPQAPTHSHSIANALPRARSMVNMDANTAAAFAHARSKERALSGAQMPQRRHSNYEPERQMVAATSVRLEASDWNTGLAPASGVDLATSALEGHAAAAAVNPRLGPRPRIPSTGRGPMVRELVGKYDKGEQQHRFPRQQTGDSHITLRDTNYSSMVEGVHPRKVTAHPGLVPSDQRAMTQAPVWETLHDRYGGSLYHGYEGRGYGFGGSAPTRQLHSAANRTCPVCRCYCRGFCTDLSRQQEISTA
jgi:hypothetical protein